MIAASNPDVGGGFVGASFPDYLDWREQTQSFLDLATYNRGSVVTVEGERPERLRFASVSAEFFPLLGVRPLLGRTLRGS